MNGFTPAQEEAIEKVYDILREHFEGSVFAVVANSEDSDSEEISTVYFHGGRMQAIGLVTMAQVKILNKEPDRTGEIT